MREADWRKHPVFGDDMSDTDRYLYHYTSLERAELIAASGSIWASPLTRLNDPRESQTREFAWMRVFDHTSADHGRGEEAALMAHLHQLRSRVRLACFTRDGDLRSSANLTRVDRRGYSRSAMWAHYGGRHAGVCLVLDRGRLEACVDRMMQDLDCPLEWVDVEYVEGFDHRQFAAETLDLSDSAALANHHRSAVLPSLRSKNRDWSYENERRLVVDEWNEDVCSIPLDDCVAGIVLGVDFAESDLDAVREIAAAFGLGDSVAKVVVYPNVLVPYPAMGADGLLHAWSDRETRMRDLIFDE